MPLRSYTYGETVLSQRRRFERPLFLMILLGIVAFGLATTGQVFYVVSAVLAVGLNLLAAQRGKEVYLHRIFVNIGVVVATIILLLELRLADQGHEYLLLSLAHYLILIQLCKLFEKKTNRDYVQLLVLNLLLMLVPAFLCQRLWFGVVLVCYLSLACYTVVLFILKRGLDAAGEMRLATETEALSVDRVKWNVIRDWPKKAIRGTIIYIFLVMLTVGTCLFMVMPHEGGGGLLGQSADPLSNSGFAQNIRLGDVRGVFLSDKVVMHVRYTTDNGGPPPESATYLCGRTYWVYADSRWAREMPDPMLMYPLVDIEPVELIRPADVPGRVVTQEISMSPSLLPVAFVAHPVLQVDSQGGGVRPLFNGDVNIVRNGSGSGPVRYKVQSWTQPLSAAQRDFLLENRPAILSIPKNLTVPPAVRRLAEQWCADLLEKREQHPLQRDQYDLAIADRLAENIRQRCTYSLDLADVDPRRDGVEDFLFHMKKGHCEYFASALTVMCQLLDVRARLATGFKVDLPSVPGESVAVRERYAHAWTEVYTPGTGWVIRDATPPGAAEEPAGFWASLNRLWSDLQFLWYDKIVGYDSDMRERLLAWFENVGNGIWNWIRTVWMRVRDGCMHFLLTGEMDTVVQIMAVVLTAFTLLVVLLLARQYFRYRRLVGAAMKLAGLKRRHFRFMYHLLRLLKRRGLTLHTDQTPRELVALACKKFDLPRRPLDDMVALYYRMRWGMQSVYDNEIALAEEQVREVRQILKQNSNRKVQKSK